MVDRGYMGSVPGRNRFVDGILNSLNGSFFEFFLDLQV
jgi:hypothetical protein